MKTKILMILIVLAVGVLVWVGLNRHAGFDASPPQSLLGTKLQFVGQHGRLRIYMDLHSTNEMADFAVFEGHECVVMKVNAASNTVESSYFENGFNVLVTKRDKNNQIMERSVSYDNGSMGVKYTYVDEHGGGLWDGFLDQGRKQYYVRSNLCWILRYPAER